MQTSRTASRAALAGVIFLLWAGSASSLSMPPELRFRMSVASSNLILVGSVASTEPIDMAAPWKRFSHLVVERPLHGDIFVGDTLRVEWHAQTWPTKDPDVFGGLADPIPQLDKYTGVRALYLLVSSGRFTRLNGEWPVALSPPKREKMQAMVSWIRTPPPDDMLAEALEDPAVLARRCGRIERETLDARLDVFASYLEDYLEAIGASNEQEGAAGT